MMPGMDGIETLKRIRSQNSASALPVIMVTAKSESTNIVDALELGANDYVTKQVDFAVALARCQYPDQPQARGRAGRVGERGAAQG